MPRWPEGVSVRPLTERTVDIRYSFGGRTTRVSRYISKPDTLDVSEEIERAFDAHDRRIVRAQLEDE